MEPQVLDQGLDVINDKLTKNLRAQEKYVNFNQWLKARGIQTGGVEYPIAFGDSGIIGAAAMAPIPSRQAFISIPNSVIISYEKARQSELKSLFKQNKELFDAKENDEAGVNILTVFVMFERLKGKKSAWNEYFDIIESPETIIAWTPEEIAQIPDPYIQKQAAEFREQVNELWQQIKPVLVAYSHLFAKSTVTKELFLWAYNAVMSRCFGYTEQGTCLVPFADCLNHSKYHSSYLYVHKKYEINGKKQKNNQKDSSIISTSSEENNNVHAQYNLKNEFVDLSIIDPQLSNKEIMKENPSEILKYIRSFKEVEETTKLTESTVRPLLMQEVRNINHERLLTDDPPQDIWELPFFSTSEEEDNDEDSDDEEASKNVREINTVKLRENSSMREALEKVRRYEEKLRTQPKMTPAEEAQAKIARDKADQVYQQEQLAKQIAKNQAEELKSQKLANQTNQEEQIDSQDTPKELYLLNEDSLDWYSYNDDDVYFIFASDKPILKGEQVYNFYGRRSNRYLLCWYGFTYPKNEYDSFEFKMLTHRKNEEITEQSAKSLIFCDYVTYEEWESEIKLPDGKKAPPSVLSKGFYLKDSFLCEDLLNYIRISKMSTYNGVDRDQIMLTRPKSLNFELRTLESTIILLQELLYRQLKTYPAPVSSSLFKSKQHFNFSVILHESHLAAIQRQLSLFGIAKEILEGVARNRNSSSFRELYMKTYPQYETEQQFIVNREYLRYYLKSLYEGIVLKIEQQKD